jgi:hypothetical protein
MFGILTHKCAYHRNFARGSVVLLLFAGVASADDPPMQQFTSTDGRFSVLFPGAPDQSSQPIQLKGGESITIYTSSAEADNKNTSYIVMYNDYPARYVSADAQTILQNARNGAVAGKTMLSDTVIQLNGIPGRAYTANDPQGYHFDVHEYLAGTRFYQLIITTSSGQLATQRDPFMNSFRIL